jgi:hypothetical protein
MKDQDESGEQDIPAFGVEKAQGEGEEKKDFE